MPRLAERLDRAGNGRVVSEDRKDGADADADIQVRRTVERIEDDAVFAAIHAALQDRRFFIFLGCDARDGGPAAEALHEDVVRDDVELLLGLAVHVRAAAFAQDVFDARAAYFAAIAFAARDRADSTHVKSPVAP